MTHRKVYSQGNIPFSWEDSPGVSKAIHHDHCPKNEGLHVLNLQSSPPDPKEVISAHQQETKIPLPPAGQNLQLPRKITSAAKGLSGRWQEDPFLAAYKECTKNVMKNGNENCGRKLHSEKKNEHSNSNVCKLGTSKKKRTIFSCKNSCDVKDDNLVRLSNLPPIPSNRNRRR